jgi:hypothetical protein
MKSRIVTIVAGLFCVLAAQVGVSSATTGVSGARADERVQGKVRIHLKGTLTGPQFAAVGRGVFTLSGAISDRGTFVDRFQGIYPPFVPYVRRLAGAKGTIWLVGDGISNDGRKGHWRITKGTKAYSGLRGRGRVGINGGGRIGPGESYGGRGIDLTIVGTVSR